jgi:hypothetical protein
MFSRVLCSAFRLPVPRSVLEVLIFYQRSNVVEWLSISPNLPF